ncbi:MAG: alanine--glyoxylate aminotransferase family protein [Candidatus Bathyarchaeia archaeon]
MPERKLLSELKPPERLLLGPGPSNLHPRVVKALTAPLIGHLDPYFLETMDETVGLLREAFRTENEITFPISGTGSAGMEAALCNLVEEGDEVLVGVNGLFGERMAEIVQRYGGRCVRVEEEWGDPLNVDSLEESLRDSNAKIICVVHVETSSGVINPVREIGRLAEEYDVLFLVDAVSSLGGCELEVDGFGIDVCYSGTQKCLNSPPGLSPITFSEKAMEAIRNRRSKVKSWYFDVSMIEKYWSSGSRSRFYHHTAPINLIYALRESLRILLEQGLEESWRRHRAVSEALIDGLEAMGLEMLVEEHIYRAPTLNAVKTPGGVDEAGVRGRLLSIHGIEVGGGLGRLTGKVWRVGLMGQNASPMNVILLLKSLEEELRKEGFHIRPGEGVAHAMDRLRSQPSQHP